MHALFAGERERASPYHPSDRRFLDAQYIDVTALPEFAQSPAAREALARHPVTALAARSEIDYAGVWAAKRAVLEACFEAFARQPGDDPRVAAFHRFVAQGGERLRRFAAFEAAAAGRPGVPWQRWPEELRRPDGPGVAGFAFFEEENRMRTWMTWLVGLAVLLALLATLVPEEVWARAGGGISSGSRGSRSYSSPSRTYSAPVPSTSPQPSTQPRTAPAPAPVAQPAPAGGFLRSMAGGIVGGLLGGLLFRSLGFAGGPGEGFGGGFGLMDLLLLAGIAYLIFWFIRRNRAAQEMPAAAYSSGMSTGAYGSGATATLDAPAPSWQQDLERGLGHLRQMDPGFDEGAFRELFMLAA